MRRKQKIGNTKNTVHRFFSLSLALFFLFDGDAFKMEINFKTKTFSAFWLFSHLQSFSMGFLLIVLINAMLFGVRALALERARAEYQVPLQ